MGIRPEGEQRKVTDITITLGARTRDGLPNSTLHADGGDYLWFTLAVGVQRHVGLM